MTLQDIGITISGYDHASGVIDKVGSRFKNLKREIQGAWEAGNKLKAISQGMNAAGNGLMAAGTLAGASLGFRGMTEDAVKAQHSLAQLGNIANLSSGELVKVQESLLGMSRRTNQTQADLIGGLTALMGRGMAKNDAMQVLESIGKTATATGATVEDLSKTVFTATSTMKMPLSQVGQLFDSLAQAGKEGSFELKDMAKAMPELAAKAANLGMSGHRGVVQLAAWGQIAKMGTDDPAVAANNLANFLDKITGREATARFAAQGIDLRAATTAAWQSGDFIGGMLETIRQTTKGDTFKLNELFGDVQVKNFLNPALQNLDRYRQIASSSMGAKGVVGQDYARMMDTFSEKAKKLRIQLNEAFVPVATPWMEKAGKLLDLLNRHPRLFSIAVNGAVAMLGVGLILKVASMALSLHSAYTRLASSCALVRNAHLGVVKVFHTATAASWGFVKSVWAGASAMVTTAAGGIKAFTLATWGTVKALLAQAAAWAMTPFGMITTAIMLIAGAGIWLWKNWDRVTAWFKGAWSWFQGLWAKVPGWAKWLFPIIQIPMLIIKNWDKIKAFFSGLWTFIKGMAQKFWEAGKNIVAAIWEGIKSMAMAPVNAVKGIVTKIRRFLPFSPAKEGPLTDIHKIRLVETIAEGIKPGALVSKMGQLARVMVPTLALAVPGSAAGRPAITVNLTVQVQGTAQDGRKLAQEMMPEIIRQLEIHRDMKDRRSHR